MNVLSGLCVGGPKDGTTLATMHGRRVTHPDDVSGAYFHKVAQGVEPAKWIWVKNKESAK